MVARLDPFQEAHLQIAKLSFRFCIHLGAGLQHLRQLIDDRARVCHTLVFGRLERRAVSARTSVRAMLGVHARRKRLATEDRRCRSLEHRKL